MNYINEGYNEKNEIGQLFLYLNELIKQEEYEIQLTIPDHKTLLEEIETLKKDNDTLKIKNDNLNEINIKKEKIKELNEK